MMSPSCVSSLSSPESPCASALTPTSVLSLLDLLPISLHALLSHTSLHFSLLVPFPMMSILENSLGDHLGSAQLLSLL